MRYVQPETIELEDKLDNVIKIFVALSDEDKARGFFHEGGLLTRLAEEYPKKATYKFKYTDNREAVFFCGNKIIPYYDIVKYFYDFIGKQVNRNSHIKLDSFNGIRPEYLYAHHPDDHRHNDAFFYVTGINLKVYTRAIYPVATVYNYYDASSIGLAKSRWSNGDKNLASLIEAGDLIEISNIDFKSLADVENMTLNTDTGIMKINTTNFSAYNIQSLVNIDTDAVYNRAKVSQAEVDLKSDMRRALKEYIRLRRAIENPKTASEFFQLSINDAKIFSRKEVIALDDRIIDFYTDGDSRVVYTIDLYHQPVFCSNKGYTVRYNHEDYKKVRFVCDLNNFSISASKKIFHSGQDGGPLCMGSYSSEMAFAMEERDFEKLTYQILTFVSNRNTNDTRGGRKITETTSYHRYPSSIRMLPVDVITPNGPINVQGAGLPNVRVMGHEGTMDYLANNSSFREELVKKENVFFYYTDNMYYDFFSEELIEINTDNLSEQFNDETIIYIH